MSRPSKIVLNSLAAVVVALSALLYFRIRFAVPTDKLEPVSATNREPEWPPGEPVPIKLVMPKMSSIEHRDFLNANYTIVQKVADLPTGIRRLYTLKGGFRVAIADPDLLSRRLIFAGVAKTAPSSTMNRAESLIRI